LVGFVGFGRAGGVRNVSRKYRITEVSISGAGMIGRASRYKRVSTISSNSRVNAVNMVHRVSGVSKE
jgi:hypothetical protein